MSAIDQMTSSVSSSQVLEELKTLYNEDFSINKAENQKITENLVAHIGVIRFLRDDLLGVSLLRQVGYKSDQFRECVHNFLNLTPALLKIVKQYSTVLKVYLEKSKESGNLVESLPIGTLLKVIVVACQMKTLLGGDQAIDLNNDQLVQIFRQMRIEGNVCDGMTIKIEK